MIFSIHTFEITITPNAERFNKVKDKAYDNAKGSHKMYPDKKRLGVYHDTALKDKGVKIEYHDGTYKKRIKLIVNPTKVLGGDDVIKLWKPKEEKILKLISKLEKLIKGYFNSKYVLNDFKLTRMDFTVNINVGSSKNVAAYIKILRNIGKVKGFSPKYDEESDWIDTDLSFDLEGNSNGIEFTAYDKEAESKRKDATGILRVEVRLTKLKAIRNHTEEIITSAQIGDLALRSREIFLATFTDIVPYGDYYKKPEATAIINSSNYKKNQKKRMLRLLELIPKKKSLYLAQKEMNDRNIDGIMDLFGQLYVSPVTIRKRHKVNRLDNLYSYLLGE